MSVLTRHRASPFNQRIPPAVLATAGVATLVVLVVLTLLPPEPSGREWLLAGLVVVLSAVAYRYPITFAPKRLVYVHAALHALALLT